ncbi:MAG: hypothetical protein QNI84_13060 [Henriciella sp.]|nr:hypothetical protein [Henriciella sp.]
MMSNKLSALYRVYGMLVESALDLPELTRVTSDSDRGDQTPDVTIEIGNVPEHLPGQEDSKIWVQVDDRTCLLRFPAIGRVLVEDGRHVLVEKDPRASYDDLRAFLVGSGLATVAHQRGLVPLHVSAILAPDGVIAFTGESGAGKSTIAAHINRTTDWPLVSDDVSGLYRSADGFFLESGVNTVKLWQDALQSLDLTSDGLKRDLTRHDKFHAIEPSKFRIGRFPLKRLILLQWGDTLELQKLTGRHAFQVALGAIYRPELAAICGNRDTVVEAAMALSAGIEVEMLTRPKDASVEKEVMANIDLAVLGQQNLAL